MLSVKRFVVFLILMSLSGLLFANAQAEDAGAGEDANVVEVLHWWTSGGEAAALNVLKEDLEGKGIEWIDAPIAGGGGGDAMTILRSRAAAGDLPEAAQMLGFDIVDVAELGYTTDLSELAQEEGWEAVVPEAVKAFSKYDGKWIAAPVNVHSTNWVWGNKKIMDELGLDRPRTWDDFVNALQAAEDAGYVGLAHGGQAWQDATLFDAVVVGAGGPDFYKSALIDLNQGALSSPTMLEAFKRMEVLRGFVDENFSGRDWNLASAMVIEGKALFQMMGDWAKGEFLKAGLVPDVDFVGFRTPGTQGTVTFNADQFVLFNSGDAKFEAQKVFASAVLSPSFQIAFNTVKGSVPARTGVSDADFTIIGKNAMMELAEANANGTLHGSLAHGYGAPAAVKNAVYDVVTAHFNQQISSEEAVEKLASSVAAAQ